MNIPGGLSKIFGESIRTSDKWYERGWFYYLAGAIVVIFLLIIMSN